LAGVDNEIRDRFAAEIPICYEAAFINRYQLHESDFTLWAYTGR